MVTDAMTHFKEDRISLYNLANDHSTRYPDSEID